MHRVGRIAELWRYPVKSMGGEQCASLELTPYGIAGDRQLAFESMDAPIGRPLLRAAQRAAMLRLRAGTAPAGGVLVHSPTGNAIAMTEPDAALLLAQELASLDPALSSRSAAAQHAWLRLLASPRPLTDVRPVALHSLQTALQLAAELDANRLPGFDLDLGFDARRLRSNIVLDLAAGPVTTAQSAAPSPLPFPEAAFAGHSIQIGDTARLRITETIPRCRIVSLAPETAAHDPHLLRHLAREHKGRAGIYARPLTPGILRQDDPVFLL